MLKIKKQTDSVYMHNWKDILFITKDRAGTWYYTCNTLKMLARLKNKFPDNKAYQYGTLDWYEIGITTGAKIYQELEKCKANADY